ncbi:CD1375 family protein [Bacillota bacterium Meth-B3]
MIELYAVLIINGKRTVAQVPTRYQDAVRQLLADAGLNENGDPIQPGA